MKNKTILLLALTLACIASGPPTATGQTTAERKALATQYGTKDPTALSSGARGLMQTGGNVILDAKTGELTNPTGGAIPIGDDVNLQPPSDGGNLGNTNGLTGIINCALIPFGTMTNGAAAGNTKALMDDTPAGEFAAVTEVGDQPTLSNDATIARVGTNSLKAAFTATAAAGDGFAWTAFSSEDWESQESVGMWVYCDKNLAAGDLTLVLTDDGGARTFNFPAVSKNVWTWVEIDISSLAGGTGDAITNWSVKLSTAGAAALSAFNLYLDGAYKWDADEELTLGVDLVDSPGAVRSVLAMTKANTGTHNMTALVEGTDYFVNYQSGNDVLVTITDQSANAAFALVLHK